MNRQAIEAGVALKHTLQTQISYASTGVILSKRSAVDLLACIEAAQALLVERDEIKAKTLEEAATLVENYVVHEGGDEPQLTRRMRGNLHGVGYADAILALKKPAND